MARPCECGACRLCWLAANDARYQAAWDLPVTAPEPAAPFVGPPPAPMRTRLCLHLGERVNVPGQVRNWHMCKKGHGTVCPCGACRTCGDYEASEEEDPEPRRHLLFHLLPVAGNGCWQRNLDQLKWRMPLFTGRKVIAVCVSQTFTDTNTGRGTFSLDPPEAVAEYLAGTGCEIITVPNDPTCAKS
jgi:hypothetical protein